MIVSPCQQQKACCVGSPGIVTTKRAELVIGSEQVTEGTRKPMITVLNCLGVLQPHQGYREDPLRGFLENPNFLEFLRAFCPNPHLSTIIFGSSRIRNERFMLCTLNPFLVIMIGQLDNLIARAAEFYSHASGFPTVKPGSTQQKPTIPKHQRHKLTLGMRSNYNMQYSD
jgi:hypothetical protein